MNMPFQFVEEILELCSIIEQTIGALKPTVYNTLEIFAVDLPGHRIFWFIAVLILMQETVGLL
jgi:hypothetical protein